MQSDSVVIAIPASSSGRLEHRLILRDGTLDHGVIADSEVGQPALAVVGPLGVGLEAVGADQHRIAHRHVPAEARADADDAVDDLRPSLDHTAVANQTLFQGSATEPGRRQVTHGGRVAHT